MSDKPKSGEVWQQRGEDGKAYIVGTVKNYVVYRRAKGAMANVETIYWFTSHYERVPA